jgi:hypothetical protein
MVGQLRQVAFVTTPHGPFLVWLPVRHGRCGDDYLTPLPQAAA